MPLDSLGGKEVRESAFFRRVKIQLEAGKYNFTNDGQPP